MVKPWRGAAGLAAIALVGCSQGPVLLSQCQQLEAAIVENEISPAVDPYAASLLRARQTAQLASTIKRMNQTELSAALERCEATIGAECYQFRDALLGRARVETKRVGKAVRLAQAEESDRIASALGAVIIEDAQLNEQRNRLVGLYQSAGKVGLVEAGLIEKDGSVQPAADQTYAQIAAERDEIRQNLQNQRQAMAIYCKLE